ncbi:hypothetical protein BASA50_000827 [Batrachochytrium salamandrivorans]|uniref:Uncharacterized protein n=1 Tax=Batrachochytrium salamandrivorans TaxID=1357716 RepID=A0ABQ8EV08_9FUNG|nr:hypothetical protein BASA62_010169 [Batrachochytrium salamandrivorans]KAH6585882.1 hypothetical protein BASA50_000827 [Batrachochytrium salamandrivorans]KAH6593794.1 hypothetical protein BASA61_004185 [Batrachochytrium salamandrivorans]KAH9275837.1 hypothetical protein BASA83_001641 [Batrachochytrium salamandrivorans]
MDNHSLLSASSQTPSPESCPPDLLPQQHSIPTLHSCLTPSTTLTPVHTAPLYPTDTPSYTYFSQSTRPSGLATSNPILRSLARPPIRPSPSLVTPTTVSPISLEPLSSSFLLDQQVLLTGLTPVDLHSSAMKRHMDCLLEQTIQSLQGSLEDLNKIQRAARQEQALLAEMLDPAFLKEAIASAVRQYIAPIVDAELAAFKVQVASDIGLVRDRSDLISGQMACMIRLLDSLVAASSDHSTPPCQPGPTANCVASDTRKERVETPPNSLTTCGSRPRRVISVGASERSTEMDAVHDSVVDTDIWGSPIHNSVFTVPFLETSRKPSHKKKQRI